MNILFLITGLLLIQLFKVGDVHVDAFSFCYILYNFSLVGMLGILFMPMPLLMKQCYMVGHLEWICVDRYGCPCF